MSSNPQYFQVKWAEGDTYKFIANHHSNFLKILNKHMGLNTTLNAQIEVFEDVAQAEIKKINIIISLAFEK